MMDIKKLIDLSQIDDKKTKDLIHEAMSVVSNTILSSIVSIIRKKSLRKIDRDTRLEIASKVTADINDIIIPLHKMIDGMPLEEDEFMFDGTEFARAMKAISEDLSMIVTTTEKDGRQHIQASVGKRLEIDKSKLDDETIEKLEKMALATEVAKA